MSQRYVGERIVRARADTALGIVCETLAIVVGVLVADALVQRRERRLGRRYYRTVGEPEKVVWLGASGLD